MEDYERMPPPPRKRQRRRYSSTSSVVSSLASVSSSPKKLVAHNKAPPRRKTKTDIGKNVTRQTRAKSVQQPVWGTSSLITATCSGFEVVRKDPPPTVPPSPLHTEYMAVAHALQDEVHQYFETEEDPATQHQLHRWCRRTTQQLAKLDASARKKNSATCKQTAVSKQLAKELQKIEQLKHEIRTLDAKTHKSTAGPGQHDKEHQRQLAASRFLNGIDALRRRGMKRGIGAKKS